MADLIDVLNKSKKTLVSELTQDDIRNSCDNASCVNSVSELVKKLNGTFKTHFKKFLDQDIEVTREKNKIAEKIKGGANTLTEDEIRKHVNAAPNANQMNLLGQHTTDAKKKFQFAAREQVLAASPSQQLILLQELQEQIPHDESFVLVDPYRRPYSGEGNPKYGPQDLYYFLSDHFSQEMNMNRNHGLDPFYQPILYPDDLSVDQVLQQLIIESPYQKFLRLYDNYSKMKEAPEMYADRIKHIYRILSDPNHVSNPWYATKFIPGQTRPMEEYMNQEFNATLRKFAEKYASDPKPITKKVSIGKQ